MADFIIKQRRAELTQIHQQRSAKFLPPHSRPGKGDLLEGQPHRPFPPRLDFQGNVLRDLLWLQRVRAEPGGRDAALKGCEVSFQWKNPDFLFKNPDTLIRNPDFLLKNG